MIDDAEPGGLEDGQIAIDGPPADGTGFRQALRVRVSATLEDHHQLEQPHQRQSERFVRGMPRRRAARRDRSGADWRPA